MICVRNALNYGRLYTVVTAIGLSIGVAAHVVIALMGGSLLLTQSPFLYGAVKYAGAAYLVYLGAKALAKAWCSSRSDGKAFVETVDEPGKTSSHKGLFFALAQGVMTNLLNPKALIFFTAVLSQFVSADMSVIVKMLYGVISTTVEVLWFSFVAFVLTSATIRQKFLKFMRWVEGIFGFLLIGLGVSVALASL